MLHVEEGAVVWRTPFKRFDDAGIVERKKIGHFGISIAFLARLLFVYLVDNPISYIRSYVTSKHQREINVHCRRILSTKTIESIPASG